MVKIKSREEVKAELSRNGVNIADWARKHSLSPATVHGVLAGNLKGRRGQAHKTAVLLGIKDGVVSVESV
ncbi:MAG: DNA-binding protein [Burkholderiaceae bacterium]|nr:DNA-binding protein [Burkholderiaceae bacterium]